jgi:hypothetical protein
MTRVSRLFSLALVLLFLSSVLGATAKSSRAPQPAPRVGSSFAHLWGELSRLLGLSSTNPNDRHSALPAGDNGSTMDPNGKALLAGDNGSTMDPDGRK